MRVLSIIPIRLLLLVFFLCPALAAHADDEIKAYKAFIAKYAISNWAALPVFYDRSADVGTFYQAQGLPLEQPASRGRECYPDRVLQDPVEHLSFMLEQDSGLGFWASIGAPIKRFLVEAGVDIDLDHSSRTLFRAEKIVSIAPHSTNALLSPDKIASLETCEALWRYMHGTEFGVVAYRLFYAAVSMEHLLGSTQQAEVSAALSRQSPARVEATIGLRGRGTYFLQVKSGRTLIAFQPLHINKRRVAEIHAYFKEDPETYAELRMLVDSFLSGSDPEVSAWIIARIRAWLERNEWAGTTLEDFKAQLFSGEDVEPLIKALSDVDRGTMEANGYLAAALTIGQE